MLVYLCIYCHLTISQTYSPAVQFVVCAFFFCPFHFVHYNFILNSQSYCDRNQDKRSFFFFWCSFHPEFIVNFYNFCNCSAVKWNQDVYFVLMHWSRFTNRRNVGIKTNCIRLAPKGMKWKKKKLFKGSK